jgi:hypothetical protein
LHDAVFYLTFEIVIYERHRPRNMKRLAFMSNDIPEGGPMLPLDPERREQRLCPVWTLHNDLKIARFVVPSVLLEGCGCRINMGSSETWP